MNEMLLRFPYIYAALTLLWACFLCSSFASAADNGVVSSIVRFGQPQFARETNGYTRISFPGCSDQHRTGMPVLPFKTIRLLLPPSSRITGLTTESPDDSVTINLTEKLAFGRIPRSTDRNTIYTHDIPDQAVYSSFRPYPAKQVELVSVQHLAGYDIAILRVFPAQYVPALDQLVFSSAMTVSVAVSPDITTPNARAVSPPASRREHARAAVSRLVDNPDQLHVATPGELPVANSVSSGYDYLLITGSNLLSSFQALLDYHSAQGLNVKAETVEIITASYSGVDAAEKLRNFIRVAYTNWGIQYVLLGGDAGVVPWRGVYARCSGETESFMPSDLYFACLDGSWNSDGDSLWGEPTDGDGGGDVDLLAEVFVGRAPVDTPAEVQRFVSKTLNAVTHHQGQMQTLFSAEYLGSAAQGGDALDTLLPAFTNSHCRVSWLDDRPNQFETWYKAEALQALNLSPNLVLHYGHTDESTMMRMTVDDLDALTNHPAFLFYSTGCDAGAFDNVFWTDCIGEELVMRNQFGAFAALVNSREGWFDILQEWLYSGEFQKQFFDGLLSGSRPVVGMAHQLAKQDLLGLVETTGDMPYRWCYFGITLLSDPYIVYNLDITPAITITSEYSSVPYLPGTVSLAGRVNDLVRGFLQWTNTANSAGGVYGPVQPGVTNILLADIPLAAGANFISVTCSNLWGDFAGDIVSVTRLSYAESAPAIDPYALIFPAENSILSSSSPTNIIWNPAMITDDIDLTNLIISSIGLYYQGGTTMLAKVATSISNSAGSCSWPLQVGNVSTTALCVLRFDVIDSDGLTNSMIFNNNPFTIVPEPVTTVTLFLLLALVRRKQ